MYSEGEIWSNREATLFTNIIICVFFLQTCLFSFFKEVLFIFSWVLYILLSNKPSLNKVEVISTQQNSYFLNKHTNDRWRKMSIKMAPFIWNIKTWTCWTGCECSWNLWIRFWPNNFWCIFLVVESWKNHLSMFSTLAKIFLLLIWRHVPYSLSKSRGWVILATRNLPKQSKISKIIKRFHHQSHFEKLIKLLWLGAESDEDDTANCVEIKTLKMRPRSEPQWDCFIIVWAGYCGFVKLLNTGDDWFIRAEETWYDCKETIVLSSALPCTTITLEIGSAFTQVCPMHWSTSQASAWSMLNLLWDSK